MKKITVLLLIVMNVSAFAQQEATLKKADSLFAKQEWKAAKQNYLSVLKDTSSNPI